MSAFHVTVEQARVFAREARHWDGGKGPCTCDRCRSYYCAPAFGHREPPPLVNPEEDRVAQALVAERVRHGR